MLSMSEALGRMPSDADEAIQKIADAVSVQYDSVCAPEEFYSEFMLWFAERPERSEKWFYVDEEGNKQFGWRSFRWDVRRVMKGYGIRQWRISKGRDPEDDLDYRRGELAKILPYVWQSEVLAVTGEKGEPRSGKPDPHRVNQKTALIIDVRTAYMSVIRSGSKWDETLQGLYRLGMSQKELGGSLGVTQQAVGYRNRAALNAILAFLNNEPNTTLDDGPGTRRAMSNDAAQNLTRAETNYELDGWESQR